MVQTLGLVLISFAVTSLLLVPFIDLLYRLRNKYKKPTHAEDSNTPIHNRLLVGKDRDTPVGGGILIIPIVVVLSIVVWFLSGVSSFNENLILIFTILSFGAIGFVDDFRKIFAVFSGKFKGTRSLNLFFMQTFFALIISSFLYFVLNLNNLFIPVFGNIVLGWIYIPMAVFVIVSFTNAYNISDGLDGLSTGLLTICLIAFLILAHAVFDRSLSIFVGVWIGALIAYLYFNVFPARIYLGDAGAYAFGATLAVVGLLTGKTIGMAVIAGVFILIVSSSLLQIVSKRIFNKKILPVAPIHMYFRYIGWEEPKIVMRFWLAGVVFAIFGLWLALLSS